MHKRLKILQAWVDKLTTGLASALIFAMFLVLIANVILRLIPSIGGFKWYMEFSQYANVWAMMIGAAGIAVQGTNLRVEIIDALVRKYPWGHKLTKIIVDVFLLAFYAILTASGRLLSSRALQAVSTMPKFKMGQVYSIFPLAGVLCIAATIVHLLVVITDKKDGKENRTS